MRQKLEDAFVNQAELIGLLGAVFIALAIGDVQVAKTNRHVEFYLTYQSQSRRLTAAFDAGCLDDECRWWPSWSVMCKRKKK